MNLPVVGPLIALVAFMIGAALAGRLGRGTAAGWSARTSLLLAVVTVALAATSALRFVGDRLSMIDADVLTALLGLAMGVQAGAARAVATKDVTTVVVTSTLVGLVYDSRLGAGSKQRWARRLVSVVLIGAGACSGARLVEIHFGWSVVAATVITAVVVVVGESHRRSRGG
jgi:uncharacterized membrane protein YoaK (UPF0700 family)